MGEAGEATAALTAIAEKDPGFDIEAFLSEATDVFLAVDRARTTGATDDVHRVVADSAWAALALDQPPVAPHGRPELTEPVVVRASTNALDTIVVRITATVDGHRSVQDWTFQRPGTARTQTRTSECPNCGAKDSMGDGGRCRYCNVTLTSDVWRVSRTTAVAAEPGDEVLGKAEIIAAIREAAASRPSSTSTPTSSSTSSGCFLGTVLRVVVLIAVVAAGVALYGWLVPDSAVHDTVAKIIPATKRAHLDGTTTIASEVPGTAPFTLWWDQPKQCSGLAGSATTFAVTGTLETGATIAVTFRTKGLPFGSESPGTNQVVVTYDDAKAAVHQVWEQSTSGGASIFVLAGDGSGQASFSDLPATFTTAGLPVGPMNGSMAWTCADR